MSSDEFLGKSLFYYSSTFANETKLVLLYGVALFLIPFFSTNQLIVGTIVNALLIGSALKVKSKKVFFLSIIPSIAAFSAGILFGGLNSQLLLMLPLIWCGNALLMLVIRRLGARKLKKNYFYSLLGGTTTKAILLFSGAATLFNLGAVPFIFLTAFGIVQFVTAISGGLIVKATQIIHAKLF
ncbi:MAG: hypothetical protein NTY48_00795 [Candidatus Diapherotrites archaeon]|nr:hypothetical protein [Candidatus Diapherotrites archaeon]